MGLAGDLVVNLGVNNRQFSGGLTSAQGTLRSFASGVTSGLSKMTALAGVAAGIAAPIGVALAGVAGAVKGISEVGQAFGDIDRIAKSARAFGITTEQMVGLEHAAELSGVSVEALGKAMQKATREGTDIATVADQIAATSDPTEQAQIAFKALGRQGQDLLPLLQGGGQAIRDMMAEGAALAGFSMEDALKVEEANDAISRMKLAFTGVARDLAVSLAPLIDKVAVGMKTLGQWTRTAFASITPIIVQTGNVIVAAWGAMQSAVTSIFGGLLGTAQTTFSDITGFILDAAIMAEFAFQNIGPVAQIAWDTIKLGALSFLEDTKHIFTVGLPTVITWFSDQFGNIMFTAVDYALTIFMNLGSNIRALWQGVLDFIAGEGFHVDWTPLTEGAVNAIGSMPEIPDRIASEAESQLAGQIAAMTGNLTGDFGAFAAERKAQLTGSTSSKPAGTGTFDLSGGEQAAKASGGIGAMAGSKEALDRILNAGSSDRDAEATRKQIDLQTATRDACQQIAASLAGGGVIAFGTP